MTQAIKGGEYHHKVISNLTANLEEQFRGSNQQIFEIGLESIFKDYERCFDPDKSKIEDFVLQSEKLFHHCRMG